MNLLRAFSLILISVRLMKSRAAKMTMRIRTIIPTLESLSIWTLDIIDILITSYSFKTSPYGFGKLGLVV